MIIVQNIYILLYSNINKLFFQNSNQNGQEKNRKNRKNTKPLPTQGKYHWSLLKWWLIPNQLFYRWPTANAKKDCSKSQSSWVYFVTFKCLSLYTINNKNALSILQVIKIKISWTCLIKKIRESSFRTVM